MQRVEQGAGQWCLYEADVNKQKYRLTVAEVQQEAPEWPAEGCREVVVAEAHFADRKRVRAHLWVRQADPPHVYICRPASGRYRAIQARLGRPRWQWLLFGDDGGSDD